MFGGAPRLALAESGNSAAAHACQKGGYSGLVGTGGETFKNAGQCTSYVAHGGSFATGIIIPAGQSLTFNNPMLDACNPLSYGYTINGVSTQLGTGGGCGTVWPGNVTIGPFPTAVLVTVYLTDLKCGQTYSSDSNHSVVTPTPTGYQVDITDSGFYCEATGPRTAIPGNLSVGLVLNP